MEQEQLKYKYTIQQNKDKSFFISIGKSVVFHSLILPSFGALKLMDEVANDIMEYPKSGSDTVTVGRTRFTIAEAKEDLLSQLATAPELL
jgi:hypothetical protein